MYKGKILIGKISTSKKKKPLFKNSLKLDKIFFKCFRIWVNKQKKVEMFLKCSSDKKYLIFRPIFNKIKLIVVNPDKISISTFKCLESFGITFYRFN